MERYYESEFTQLRDRLLRMSYLALENFDRAVNGIFSRDATLLQAAVDNDRHLDQMELGTDAACVELLLRHQPFAKDLRFAAMSLKINTNLERMGDQAVSIARAGLDLMRLPPVREVFELPLLASMARRSVEQAMECFTNEDVALARAVRTGDQQINRLYRESIRAMLEFAMENPSQLPQTMELIFVSQALERVADYGKNIADEVVYVVEAVDPRHQA